MLRASFLVLAAIAALALPAWAEDGIETPAHVPTVDCDGMFKDCNSACSEEITPDMRFFEVCQTECIRTHELCHGH